MTEDKGRGEIPNLKGLVVCKGTKLGYILSTSFVPKLKMGTKSSTEGEGARAGRKKWNTTGLPKKRPV